MLWTPQEQIENKRRMREIGGRLEIYDPAAHGEFADWIGAEPSKIDPKETGIRW